MKRIIFSCILLLLLWGLCQGPCFGIRYNHSQSLPQRLFISRPFQAPRREEYVSFQTHHSSTPLVKQIIGLPGDAITNRQNHIFVNSQDCGQPLPTTSSGKPLTPQETRIIPEGYVYLYASHPKSFDSRYQDFGLIPIDDLQETLWPIF